MRISDCSSRRVLFRSSVCAELVEAPFFFGVVERKNGPSTSSGRAEFMFLEREMKMDFAAMMPLAATLGVLIDEGSKDRVAGKLPVRPEICTAGGNVHGGAIKIGRAHVCTPVTNAHLV